MVFSALIVVTCCVSIWICVSCYVLSVRKISSITGTLLGSTVTVSVTLVSVFVT